MSEEDRFGLLPDEDDPLDILFAVSSWRRRLMLSSKPGERPEVLQGEFRNPFSQEVHDGLVEDYASQAGVGTGSLGFEAISLVVRDSVLFAEQELSNRLGGTTVRVRKKPRSPLRLKLDVANAIQEGLAVPDIIKKLGVSQATVYRLLKKKNNSS